MGNRSSHQLSDEKMNEIIQKIISMDLQPTQACKDMCDTFVEYKQGEKSGDDPFILIADEGSVADACLIINQLSELWPKWAAKCKKEMKDWILRIHQHKESVFLDKWSPKMQELLQEIAK